MNGEKVLDYIKSEFDQNIVSYIVLSEGFHGPYWEINIEANHYTIKISGDIGFSIVVSRGDESIDLWRLDRSLVGKESTTQENLKIQLNSLFELIT